MKMELAELDPLQLKADLSSVFDLAIDAALAEERFSDAITVDDVTGQPAMERILEEDATLLELVFLCDARAQVDNDEHTPVNEISWVRFARDSIDRVGQILPSKQLADFRLFSDLRDQFEAFQDMAERRQIVSGSAASDFTGIEYAYRVASGEIVLSK